MRKWKNTSVVILPTLLIGIIVGVVAYDWLSGAVYTSQIESKKWPLLITKDAELDSLYKGHQTNIFNFSIVSDDETFAYDIGFVIHVQWWNDSVAKDDWDYIHPDNVTVEANASIYHGTTWQSQIFGFPSNPELDMEVDTNRLENNTVLGTVPSTTTQADYKIVIQIYLTNHDYDYGRFRIGVRVEGDRL